MKRLYLLSLLIMLFVSTSALASPRTFSQAKAIAERKAALLGIKIDKKAAAKAPSMNGGTTTAVSPYYVFPFGENKGFAIVSGDDDMPEIVGYADNGTYDANNMPAAMAAFLNNYRATIEAMKQGNASAIKNIAEAKALRANNTRATTAVSPLLGDIKWNQSEPYNNMCPKYDGTNLSATGCVATAMAQVMMYWKYPKELKADINEYKTYTHKLPVAGELKGLKYDWDNMLPTYTNNKYTLTQADAVAKLMLHCGKAVEMDYGEESGANVTPGRLAKYFGYDSDMMLDLSRTCFTLAEWTAIIDKELQAKRPILYSGRTTNGGHQFVCDGSDGNGLYHINWGWGGYQDGYFDITILNPGQGGIGAGNVTDGYNRGCDMIIGIQPDNGKVDEPLAEIPFITVFESDYNGHATSIELTKSTRQSATEKFSIKIKEWMTNLTYNDFNGKFGYGISDGNGGYQLIDDKAEFTYYIKNNGGTASVKCWTIAINAETNSGPGKERTIKFPGNGSVTTISYSYTPEQVGSNTMLGDILLFNTETNEQININNTLPKIPYDVLVNGEVIRHYNIEAINPLVYIAGKPNAISGVTDSASSYVLGGTSEITIFTEKAERLPIFRIDGSKVCDVITEANTAKHVTVAPGLYIVRGKKIVVK